MSSSVKMSSSVNMRKLSACVWVAGALIIPPLPTYAQTEPSAQQIESAAKADLSSKTEPASKANPSVEAFITKLGSGTRAIHQISKQNPTLIRAGCRDLLNEILDLDAMAQASYVDIWDKMTPLQRDTIRAAFEQRMITICMRQFGGNGNEVEHIQLAGVRTTESGHLLATVRIGPNDDGKLVTWRLHSSGRDSMRAVDVITEGRSTVLDAHNEFAAVLQSVNGDIEALIAFMQK
jgi:ABC-type transporter MlaC component